MAGLSATTESWFGQRSRAIPLCRRAGRSRQLRNPLCATQSARIDRPQRLLLPARTLDRLHARAFRRICSHEKRPSPAPSLDLCGRIVSLYRRRPLSQWTDICLGTRADWLFSLHHVPYYFCSQHQESWPAHQAGLFSPGHGDSRRRSSPRNHGTHLRCHQHPHRICCPTGLLRLHFLLRRKWLQAQQ